MSGDMCTSLGNGFSNLMIFLFIVKEKGGTAKGFVEGDDGLFATDVILTAEDFQKIGFTVKIHEVPHPLEAHFCGMCCSPSLEVLKNPRRVLQTFGWTHSCIHAGNGVMDQLLRSKALSLGYELPQCPIVGVLARETIKLTSGIVARPEVRSAYRPMIVEDVKLPPFNPSPEARRMVERLFSITVEQQHAAEAAIVQHDMEAVGRIVPPSMVVGGVPCSDMLDYSIKYVEERR
jgi:hypothetical protein